MKIYTRSGDAGTTGLLGSRRLSKAHPRLAAIGTVDELNSLVGLALVAVADPLVRQTLEETQCRLFDLGAALASPPETPAPAGRFQPPQPTWVSELEQRIDALWDTLPPLDAFILPGGAPTGALLHVARTVCRRAERQVAAAIDAGETMDPVVMAYLNRLSDFLFTAARVENARAGTPERRWPDAPADAGG